MSQACNALSSFFPVQAQRGWHQGKGILQRRVMHCLPLPPDHGLGGAENLRVELWGPFLTVSGTRKGGAMGMRDPARPSTGGKGVILRREMDYGFFSASWRLPVSTSLTLLQPVPAHVSCGGLCCGNLMLCLC